MLDESLPQPKPITFFLTEEDFARAPTIIVEYKLGDKIARENFVSFLTYSFAISRGKPTIQSAFFMWLKKKYGFDYMKTMTSFIKKNSWEALSEEERNQFVAFFNKVEKHFKDGIVSTDIESEKYIRNELKRNMQFIFSADRENKVERFFDFDKINSLTDFNVAATKCYNFLKSGKVE